MMRTLQGWWSNAQDALDLMWTEPLSWLIVVAAAVWIVRSVRQSHRLEPTRLVAIMGLAVWVVATLAITVYPLDYLEAPAADRLELESIVPLAGTIQAIADADGWTMTPEALAEQKELLAADLGVPVEEITLGPRVNGPGLSAVLKDPIGNIVLFIPLGFLAPIIWPGIRHLRKVVLVGAGASASIELAQLLFGLGSLGTVDDVIFNTLGTVLGFGLWSAACRTIRSRNWGPLSPEL